jgi:hypothetical protein
MSGNKSSNCPQCEAFKAGNAQIIEIVRNELQKRASVSCQENECNPKCNTCDTQPDFISNARDEIKLHNLVAYVHLLNGLLDNTSGSEQWGLPKDFIVMSRRDLDAALTLVFHSQDLLEQLTDRYK